jgi:hypothetical protein
MGTRSTYRVIEKGVYNGKPWKNVFCLLYVQYDGYPDGHPADTMAWLATGEVVDGLPMDKKGLVFNGAGCLAAQLIARMKTDDNGNVTPGGAYLYPIRSRCKCGEDYVYDIIVNSDDKTIEVVAYNNNTGWGDNDKVKTKVLYRGSPAGYADWLKNRKK